MIIVAVDPGLTGALAFYDTETPARVSVYDMPVAWGEGVNPREFMRLLNMYAPDIAYMEHVGPMPRDGVKQAWRFSGAFFTARAAIMIAMVPLHLVTPAKWKKDMKVSGGPEGKEACRALAIRLFPACSEAFSRKKDQGRAEAALLALYASNVTKGHAND